MKTSSAKAKGRKWQQFLCASLKEFFKWDDGDVESRPMGSPGVDIMLSPRARKDFPFSVEAKNTKTFPSWDGLEQAKYNAKPGTMGIMVWKKQREDRGMVCIDWNDFLLLIKEKND